MRRQELRTHQEYCVTKQALSSVKADNKRLKEEVAKLKKGLEEAVLVKEHNKYLTKTVADLKKC